MSLSLSLANAVSGLAAAARGAEVISSNVANATTDGYGVRRVQLASRANGANGAGVQVVGIERIVDMRVIADRRIADGQTAYGQTQLEFQSRLEDLIGLPTEAGSLSDRLSDLDAALISAVGRPDVDARLSGAVEAAKRLAGAFNDISDGIQDLRMEADSAISANVSRLNTALAQIQDMNTEISRRVLSGLDPSAEMDARQILIDEVSEIIPVKEVERGQGKVALITPGGGVLVDGKAAVFDFSPVGVITPDMTRAAGSLSGLTINGNPINLDSDPNAISGGRLDGLFSVRDEKAVTEQARVDALARDLVERFQDPAVDPTLLAGDAGLFTDGGAAFVAIAPANEEGLAARIAINAAVDPDQGGEVRRLRDGINSTTAGEVGDGTLLQALVDTLEKPRALTSAGFSGATRNFTGLSAEFLSLVGSERQSLETEVSFRSASAASLKELELRGGVDTDHEMQQLLLVEAAYQANARVIQTIDAMLDRLMEI